MISGARINFGSGGLDSSKVVARFADGRIKKGYTRDFSPDKPVLHIIRDHAKESTDPEELNLADLKAVFFVKNFAGNPNYAERKHFAEGDNPEGEKVEVTFTDGEILQGSVLRYNARESGFFFFPADPQSNNLTLFVVNTAVKKLRYLRFDSITSPSRDGYQCLIPEGYGTALMLSGEEIRLLKLVLPKIMEANSAREYIVENLGSAYIEIGEALLREIDRI
jgi:hypothetical protein